MSSTKRRQQAAEPLFEFDRKARKALLPFRETMPVRAVDAVGTLGDQAPLRAIAGLAVAAGVLRRDSRLALAGLRMLVAHEVATALKDVAKRQVIRTRPRSAAGKSRRPRKGRDTRKEESSFPSGHSAGATAVAGAVAAAYPQHAIAARSAAAALLAARVPGCAHYPSDVAAGAAIGAFAALLVNTVWRLGVRRFVRR